MLIATPLMAGDYWVHPSGYFPHTDGVFSRSSDVVPATYWTDPYEANLFAYFPLDEPQLESAIEVAVGVAPSNSIVVPTGRWMWGGVYGQTFNGQVFTSSDIMSNVPATFTNMSLACWVRPTGVSPPQGYVSLRRIGSYFGEIGIAYDDLAGRKLTIELNRARYYSNLSLPSITDMIHLGVTYDGLVERLYTNGVLAFSETVTATLETNLHVFAIGQYYSVTSSDFDIKDVRGYNRTLSGSEYADLFSAGYETIAIDTVSTNDLYVWMPFTNDLQTVKSYSSTNPLSYYPYPSYANAPTSVTVGTNEFGDVQRAYSFDGVDDRFRQEVANIPFQANNRYMSSFGTNDFAVSFWFKWKTQTSLDGIINVTGTNPFYSLLYNNKLLSGVNGGTQAGIIGDDELSTNEWHHVLIVRDYGVEFCQYVDSVKQTRITNETQNVNVGAQLYLPYLGRTFNGELSALRFYDFANTNAGQLFTNTHPTNNLLEKTKLP